MTACGNKVKQIFSHTYVCRVLCRSTTSDCYDKIPTENIKFALLQLEVFYNDDIIILFCEWLITALDGISKSSVSDDGVINREHLWTKLHQLQSYVEFMQK